MSVLQTDAFPFRQVAARDAEARAPGRGVPAPPRRPGPYHVQSRAPRTHVSPLSCSVGASVYGLLPGPQYDPVTAPLGRTSHV